MSFLFFVDIWPGSDLWPDGPTGAIYNVSESGRIALDEFEDGDTLVSVETLTTPTGQQFARLWIEREHNQEREPK